MKKTKADKLKESQYTCNGHYNLYDQLTDCTCGKCIVKVIDKKSAYYIDRMKRFSQNKI